MMEEFKILFVFLMTLLLVLKVTISLWWRPRKIEGHFSKQGIRGPPYRFFIGNVKELVGMMMKASEKPMPFSHNILPRVLSFYHHWKKIYGTFFFIIILISLLNFLSLSHTQSQYPDTLSSILAWLLPLLGIPKWAKMHLVFMKKFQALLSCSDAFETMIFSFASFVVLLPEYWDFSRPHFRR